MPVLSPFCPVVQVDWHRDGSFSGAYDTVTPDVMADPGVSIDTGRDSSLALNPPKVPACDFELQNWTGKYSNESATSPLYQAIRPGAPVNIAADFGAQKQYRNHGQYRDRSYYRGRGRWQIAATRISSIRQQATRGTSDQQRLAIQTLGASGAMLAKPINVPLSTNVRTDQAVNLVLDAAGWPGALRSVGLGDATFTYYWADERSAWDALVEITKSEGPAVFYEDAAGVLHWEGRSHRSGAARSTTPQASLYDTRAAATAGGGLYFETFEYQPGWDMVYARATYATKRRTIGVSTTIWKYGSDITLATNEQRTLYARPTTPYDTAQLQYTVSSGSATIGATYDSGFLVILNLQAGASGAVIRGPVTDLTGGIQVTGRPYTVASETIAQSSLDPADSVAAYGSLQTLDVGGWPEMDPGMAAGVCDAWVRRYRVARPKVVIGFRAYDAASLEQVVQREVSDRITVHETNTGLARDLWIEGRKLLVAAPAGQRLEAQWTCEVTSEIVGSRWESGLWDSATWGD